MLGPPGGAVPEAHVDPARRGEIGKESQIDVAKTYTTDFVKAVPKG